MRVITPQVVFAPASLCPTRQNREGPCHSLDGWVLLSHHLHLCFCLFYYYMGGSQAARLEVPYSSNQGLKRCPCSGSRESFNHWTTSSQDPVWTRNAGRVKLTTKLSNDEPEYIFCFRADLVLSSEPSLCVVKSQRSQLKETKGQVKWNCVEATDRGRNSMIFKWFSYLFLSNGIHYSNEMLLEISYTGKWNTLSLAYLCPYWQILGISKGSLGHRKPVVQSNHLILQVTEKLSVLLKIKSLGVDICLPPVLHPALALPWGWMPGKAGNRNPGHHASHMSVPALFMSSPKG